LNEHDGSQWNDALIWCFKTIVVVFAVGFCYSMFFKPKLEINPDAYQIVNTKDFPPILLNTVTGDTSILLPYRDNSSEDFCTRFTWYDLTTPQGIRFSRELLEEEIKSSTSKRKP
jgi:hypothetical protein